MLATECCDELASQRSDFGFGDRQRSRDDVAHPTLVAGKEEPGDESVRIRRNSKRQTGNRNGHQFAPIRTEPANNLTYTRLHSIILPSGQATAAGRAELMRRLLVAITF